MEKPAVLFSGKRKRQTFDGLRPFFLIPRTLLRTRGTRKGLMTLGLESGRREVLQVVPRLYVIGNQPQSMAEVLTCLCYLSRSCFQHSQIVPVIGIVFS